MRAIKSTMLHADAARVIRAPRRTATRWPQRVAVAVACSVLVSAPAVPAHAEDAAQARAQARAAAAHVRSIEVRLARAQDAYATAMSRVGQQVSDFIVADTARADAQRTADAAADRSAASARALYQSGGQAGLLNSVLSSGDVFDLAARMSGVQQVLSAAHANASDAAAQARAVGEIAAQHGAVADASVVTAAQITERADAVAALLDDAQHTLDALSSRARSLTEAEAAARELARARAAAALAQSTALGSVRAQVPPAEYFRLYRAAATTCPGMDWTLLAAVGQVESGHGRNAGVSSAGAQGPMQFMPGTFAMYGVDGDHDGRTDPYSPADAVYTAARYLCSGGGGTPSGVSAALFRYNRAQWYVDLVLSVQEQLRAQQP